MNSTTRTTNPNTGDMLQEGVDDIENGVEDVMDGNTDNNHRDPAKEETGK